MDPNQEQQLNQDAYRRLRTVIEKTYPPARFVAIARGQIVADAADFEQLDTLLHRMGIPRAEALVAQAGVDHLEPVVILAQDLQA